MKIIVFSVILTCIISVMCSGPDTYTIEEIDGIRHVHNTAPLWGDEQRIRLEYVRTIGEIDGDDPNNQFYKPAQIERDAAGNYYILDSGNHRIQVFDSDMRYMRTIGRRGQGPGEFDSLFFLKIYDDKMYVNDVGNNRMQVFSLEGELIESYKPQENLGAFGITPDGNIVQDKKYTAHGSVDNVLDKMELDMPVLQIINFDGDQLLSFGKVSHYKSRPMQFFGNSFHYDTDPDGSHIIAYAFQNRIERFDLAGNQLFRASRELGLEETTSMEDFSKVPNMFTAYTQAGSNGRTWVVSVSRPVQANEKDETAKTTAMMEIYDRFGVLLSRIPLPVEKKSKHFNINGDRLYFVDMHETMLIYEYRIVE